LGYKDLLPAPIMGIQATLSAIEHEEIHAYIQQANNATILAANETGESGEPPMLLTILDLSMWTHIFEFANAKDLPKAMERLQNFHAIIHDLLTQDFEEIDQAKIDVKLAEDAIRAANIRNEEDETKLAMGIMDHPFLKHLTINDVVKTSLEDVQDNINCSQNDLTQSTLVASRWHLAVPFTPQRSVEDQVAQKDHKVWAIGNINLLSPIPTSTWRILAALGSER
jgi:hypothetical protein